MKNICFQCATQIGESAQCTTQHDLGRDVLRLSICFFCGPGWFDHNGIRIPMIETLDDLFNIVDIADIARRVVIIGGVSVSENEMVISNGEETHILPFPFTPAELKSTLTKLGLTNDA